jgi:hypothetical protein
MPTIKHTQNKRLMEATISGNLSKASRAIRNGAGVNVMLEGSVRSPNGE